MGSPWGEWMRVISSPWPRQAPDQPLVASTGPGGNLGRFAARAAAGELLAAEDGPDQSEATAGPKTISLGEAYTAACHNKGHAQAELKRLTRLCIEDPNSPTGSSAASEPDRAWQEHAALAEKGKRRSMVQPMRYATSYPAGAVDPAIALASGPPRGRRRWPGWRRRPQVRLRVGQAGAGQADWGHAFGAYLRGHRARTDVALVYGYGFHYQ